MEQIDRRTLIASAGAGLTLAACTGKNEKSGSSKADINCVDTAFDIKSHDPSWNNGDDPKTGKPPKDFDPAWVAIWHIAFDQDLVMAVKSAHIPTVRDVSKNNNWDSNRAAIIAALDILNDPNAATPGTWKVFTGLHNLAFGQPHHLIIYVKNKRVDFDSDYPIWFGRKLRRTWKYKDINDIDVEVTTPSENKSFYGADVKTGLALKGSVSTTLIYAQNHFVAAKSNGTVEKVQKGEGFAYALNINAVIEDGNISNALLIIDPDTGNMGTGGPP